MSTFPDWFQRAYKRWRRSQPGEEDFLAFCTWVGFPPYMILSWINGDAVPEGAAALNLATIFSKRVYGVLGAKSPDNEILKIARTFADLAGAQRVKLIEILWSAAQDLEAQGISPASSDGAEMILARFQRATAN